MDGLVHEKPILVADWASSDDRQIRGKAKVD